MFEWRGLYKGGLKKVCDVNLEDSVFYAFYRFHELYLAGLTDDWMKIKDGSSLSSSPYPTTTSWRLLLMVHSATG